MDIQILPKLVLFFQIVILGVNFSLAFIVFKYSRKNHINKIFSGLVLAISLWIIGLITLQYHFFWLRLTFFGASLIMPLFFLFTASFPRKIDWLSVKILSRGIWIASIIFSMLSLLTNLIVVNIETFSPLQYKIQYGYGYTAFGLVFIITATSSIWLLIYQYRHAKGTERQQALYVLIGMALAMTLGTFTNLIIPLLTGNSFYSNFGAFPVTIFISFSFYAIIKHRLMDIRLVLRRWSVIFLSWATIILIVVFIKYAYFKFSPTPVYGADYIFIILGIVLYPVLSSSYYHAANKYFFTSLYDAQQVIANLSEKLSSTLRLNKIYKYISDSLVDSLHARTVQVYIYNDKIKKYEPSYYYGDREINQKSFVEDQGFYSNYLQKNIPIVVDELRRKSYVIYRRTIDHLLAQKFEIIVPLRLKDRTIGLVALGYKESHDLYNDEDIKLLEIIGAQSAIAIDNAINYEEVKNFSKKLQIEIKRATKDLTEANAKLKQLDQAKSEFVSIASHQLRTPLTVIKGYISMFLEGSFGKMEGLQKESMEKVYHSNERLIQLVENLLNISRIESGRIRVNKEPVNLIEMTTNVLDELSGPAKKKGLKLVFSKPKNKVLVVPLDQEKIRQVILNLIDNSIKYTKKGSINVCIKQKKDDILFCIEDKGMGIKPEDLVDLFDKFSRGTGTALVHTEGTGLGLYVAKQMIEVHGGKIWAESKGENKGSKFCFTLPLVDKEEKQE